MKWKEESWKVVPVFMVACVLALVGKAVYSMIRHPGELGDLRPMLPRVAILFVVFSLTLLPALMDYSKDSWLRNEPKWKQVLYKARYASVLLLIILAACFVLY